MQEMPPDPVKETGKIQLFWPVKKAKETVLQNSFLEISHVTLYGYKQFYLQRMLGRFLLKYNYIGWCIIISISIN